MKQAQAPPTMSASGGCLNTLLITFIALKFEWLALKLKVPPNLRLGFNEPNNCNSLTFWHLCTSSCKFDRKNLLR